VYVVGYIHLFLEFFETLKYPFKKLKKGSMVPGHQTDFCDLLTTQQGCYTIHFCGSIFCYLDVNIFNMVDEAF
jgi:hypothetical protein